MNNKRRKALYSAINEIERVIGEIESQSSEIINNEESRASFSETINNIAEDIYDVLDDEQFAYDNLPENFQYSDRGETMYDNIDALESCQSDIEDAAFEIEKGNLDKAVQLLKSAISYSEDVQ